MTVNVDAKDVAVLHRDLFIFARKALPYAARGALNTTVFEGRRIWLDQVGAAFVMRNTFTTRSLQVVKAGGTDIRAMAAFLGSVAPYMRDQEDGATLRGQSGGSKPIPTSVAAGQAQGARPRKRQVRRANWMSAIRLQGARRFGKTKAQRNAIAISRAVATGNRFVFLDLEKRQGLFRVTGTKRVRVRMVWDLSKKSVTVKPSSTLQRTLDVLAPRLPVFHRNELIHQLKRNHVLGY